MDTDSLQVDLGNRDDVRAKLPLAKRIRERKRAIANEAVADAEFWDGHVEYMSRIAGLDPEPHAEPKPDVPDEPRELDRDDVEHEQTGSLGPAASSRNTEKTPPGPLAVEVVNREARKIRLKDVQRILEREGHTFSEDAVRNALYYASQKRGGHKIKAAGRGWYAPLAYDESGERDTLLSEPSGGGP